MAGQTGMSRDQVSGAAWWSLPDLSQPFEYLFITGNRLVIAAAILVAIFSSLLLLDAIFGASVRNRRRPSSTS